MGTITEEVIIKEEVMNNNSLAVNNIQSMGIL
jgi:hypothetical protein